MDLSLTPSHSNFTHSVFQPFRDELPLLISSHKEGKKLFKKIIALNKETEMQSLYNESSALNGEKLGLDIFYYVENNRPPRVFVIHRELFLGKGAQGSVYLGQELFKHRNEKQISRVAVKISNIATLGKKNDFNNEKKMLDIQNRHRGSYISEDRKTGYLIQEFCPGISFFDWCYKKIAYDNETQLYERISSNVLFKNKMVTAILQAYHDLHQKYGILHRDVKPENIMINLNKQGDIAVRIIDFATSCLAQSSDKIFSGTPGYSAPETLDQFTTRPFYSVQTEYWSIAVTCAAWLSENNYLNYLNKKMNYAKKTTGFMPSFKQENLYEAMPDIFTGMSVLEPKKTKLSGISWSDYIINSLHFLSNKDVNQRAGYNEFSQILNNLCSYEKDKNQINNNFGLLFNLQKIPKNKDKDKDKDKDKNNKKKNNSYSGEDTNIINLIDMEVEKTERNSKQKNSTIFIYNTDKKEEFFTCNMYGTFKNQKKNTLCLQNAQCLNRQLPRKLAWSV